MEVDNMMDTIRPPVRGILTQTIIQSPLVHWILPIRLRGQEYDDVAFIGDTFVEIRRLGVGPHLYEIIRKDDFGSRIRNASVLGSLEDYEKEQVHIKEELEDVDMISTSASSKDSSSSTIMLPPQILVLQLEAGTSSDSVFLMLHQSNDGSWKFISIRRRLSKAMDKLQPGMHLSIDPSSRYMVIGGSEQCFTIQVFHTRMELNRQYANGEELRFVESERVILCKGAILKLEFLSPPAGSDDDIILLMIVAVNGKIRMLLYAWKAGDPLSTVKTQSFIKKGYPLNDIPLLIIPLRFEAAFILISDRSMAVYKGIFEGAPECISIGSCPREPTELYQGSDTPLWTAWAKPTRLPYHTAQQDDIYLAREDGWICLLEVKYDNEDPKLTPSLTDVGRMQCNIGPAFTCVDYSLDPNVHRHGDVLVSGGDASIGGTYLNTARKQPNVKKDTQNWSPAMDLVAIKNNTNSKLDIDTRPQSFVPIPDSIFVCSGKGAQSSITELRSGIEAILGLDLEFHSAVTKAWILPSEVYSGLVGGDDWVLLSLEDRSSILQISVDRTSAEELDPNHTQLDLNSRTIVAGVSGNRAIQVTEQSIIILDSGECTVLNDLDIMGFPQASSLSACFINDAVICNEKVLFTTHHKEERVLRILETLSDDSISPPTILYAPKTIREWTRDDPEVTCIAMYMHPQYHSELVIAGQRKDGEISLVLIMENEFHLDVPLVYAEGCSYDLRALSSIILKPSSSSDNFTLICGTLTGLVLSLDIVKSEEHFYIRESRSDRFGGSVATLTNGDQLDQSNFLFVNCDEKIFKMDLNVSSTQGKSCKEKAVRMKMKADQIWLLDALDTTLQQPNINSILPLRSESLADIDLLLVSYNRLLLARMGAKRKTVPRRIHIRGTPYRIIYSETRKAFVVGASVEGRSTIYFVDPKTGENLSDPRDGKRGAQTDFVAGLGRFDDKILCIYEWLYSHNAHTWNFLVVCTSDGRVLIICTKNDGSSVTPSGRAKISFWTVTQFKNFTSVYAVTGDSEGLYYCAQSGTEVKLYYSTLNKDVKKFNKNPAEVKLLSPAISLSYDSGKIYALTRHHSLQILEVIKTNGQIQLHHTHTDQLQRESLHHLQGKPNTSGSLGNSQIDLVSDRSRSVTGLCVSSGMKVDTLDTIFEAQLPASVLRLRSANCRPVWDCSWMVHKNGTQVSGDLPARLGVIHNDEINSETLGMGIDGSLYHFTMLDIPAWRFLKFLANLARSSSLVGGCPWEGWTDLEPEQTPRNMQVDGDILKIVVENGKLEELFRIGEHQTDENKREFKRFCDLLNMIHDKELKNDDDPMFYIELAYDDLEVFLRPVI
ncbi:hypothetical protein EYC80_004896 [Monilinia laxa]|uniref:RSE1/DDB1/CPSF1 first beta-propeller domain-containing protein n=2 Tax=Monilinia laxa TaxID=61186 RepID=A0A5N6KJV9_MONLA|nr:hypothetical protein EYC80_004896 [Monilinia laxa]